MYITWLNLILRILFFTKALQKANSNLHNSTKLLEWDAENATDYMSASTSEFTDYEQPDSFHTTQETASNNTENNSNSNRTYLESKLVTEMALEVGLQLNTGKQKEHNRSALTGQLSKSVEIQRSSTSLTSSVTAVYDRTENASSNALLTTASYHNESGSVKSSRKVNSEIWDQSWNADQEEDNGSNPDSVPNLDNGWLSSTEASAQNITLDDEGNDDNNTAPPTHIILLLKKNCTDQNVFSNIFEVVNKHMLNLLSFHGNKNVNINQFSCETYFHLKFIVKRTRESAVKRAIDMLSHNLTLGEDYKIIKAFASDKDIDANHLSILLIENGKNTTVLQSHEVIAYIIAAFSAFVLLFIFMTIFCIRCTSQRQTKSLDLCDIPHINLKLEDYKITPIPRPSITYQDCGRELLNYGGRQSRSDDTILSQNHFSGDATSSLANTLRRGSASLHQELRTFNGKNPCPRIQSMDIRPKRSVSQWVSESREKLNADMERQIGYDNIGFQKWY